MRPIPYTGQRVQQDGLLVSLNGLKAGDQRLIVIEDFQAPADPSLLVPERCGPCYRLKAITVGVIKIRQCFTRGTVPERHEQWDEGIRQITPALADMPRRLFLIQPAHYLVG